MSQVNSSSDLFLFVSHQTSPDHTMVTPNIEISLCYIQPFISHSSQQNILRIEFFLKIFH